MENDGSMWRLVWFSFPGQLASELHSMDRSFFYMRPLSQEEGYDRRWAYGKGPGHRVETREMRQKAFQGSIWQLSLSQMIHMWLIQKLSWLSLWTKL